MEKLKNRTVKYFDYGYTTYTPRVALELSHSVYRVCALDYYNSNSPLWEIIPCICFPRTRASCGERNNGLGIWRSNFSVWLCCSLAEWHPLSGLGSPTYKIKGDWMDNLLGSSSICSLSTSGSPTSGARRDSWWGARWPFPVDTKTSPLWLFAPLHITMSGDSNRPPNIPKP